jgi:uncharacterized protein YndB with AHSA1/START domain
VTTRKNSQLALQRQVRINAPPGTVYKYLTDPALITKWFGRKAVFEARPGGECRVEMNDRDTFSGKVVELKRPEKVVYTFGWEAKDNPIRPGSTTVEITLKPDGGGTLVTLVHTGLPAVAVEEHGKGWQLYLGRLATAAGGGDPGADPNATPRKM